MSIIDEIRGRTKTTWFHNSDFPTGYMIISDADFATLIAIAEAMWAHEIARRVYDSSKSTKLCHMDHNRELLLAWSEKSKHQSAIAFALASDDLDALAKAIG